jgi:hypothetical protein
MCWQNEMELYITKMDSEESRVGPSSSESSSESSESSSTVDLNLGPPGRRPPFHRETAWQFAFQSWAGLATYQQLQASARVVCH